MRKALGVVLVGVVALAVGASASPADTVDAAEVFEELSSLAGTWRGEPVGEGAEAAAEAEAVGEVVHEFRLSAAGTVVMETMNPGTDHEMINMYHLDGEDLLLTHYCAGGNQPVMRLDRSASTVEDLRFEFAGGTNLDPAVDGHIHGARILLVDDEHLESRWISYAAGAPAGKMSFHLARSR